MAGGTVERLTHNRHKMTDSSASVSHIDTEIASSLGCVCICFCENMTRKTGGKGGKRERAEREKKTLRTCCFFVCSCADLRPFAYRGGFSNYDQREENRMENTYLTHLCLGAGMSHDGLTDPSPFIRVRAVPGVHGCAFLTEQKVTSSLSYVFGPLVGKKAANIVKIEKLLSCRWFLSLNLGGIALMLILIYVVFLSLLLLFCRGVDGHRLQRGQKPVCGAL